MLSPVRIWAARLLLLGPFRSVQPGSAHGPWRSLPRSLAQKGRALQQALPA